MTEANHEIYWGMGVGVFMGQEANAVVYYIDGRGRYGEKGEVHRRVVDGVVIPV